MWWVAVVARPPVSLRMSRGPIGAALISLQRLGWRVVSSLEFVRDLGDTIWLRQATLALFKLELRAANTRA